MENVKVYAMTDSNGYIIAIEGGYTYHNIEDPDNWVVIDEGSGQRFDCCQVMYMPLPLMTDGGAYRYKLVDGVPVDCTAEEIASQEEANKPKTVAPRNITAGEYITVNGVLYKAILNIPNGEPIIDGKNAIATTIEAQLLELKGE